MTTAMGLLVWGIVLDGRDQRAYEEAEREKATLEDKRRLRVVDATWSGQEDRSTIEHES